jgi:hypothetical protein
MYLHIKILHNAHSVSLVLSVDRLKFADIFTVLALQ